MRANSEEIDCGVAGSERAGTAAAILPAAFNSVLRRAGKIYWQIGQLAWSEMSNVESQMTKE
jgi:hypothetical protein